MPVLAFGPIHIHFDDTVLTPRPWTLAQAAWAAELPPGPLLELGCGAGHIGLAVVALTGSSLLQVDRSEAACRWAASNAAAAGFADRVVQRHGDVTEALHPHERFAVVLADPPYIRSDGVGRYPDDPRSAIDGGEDGFDLVRTFVEVAADHLTPGGCIVLQVGGAQQIEALERWLDEPGAPAVAVRERRLHGEDRALVLLRQRHVAGSPND